MNEETWYLILEWFAYICIVAGLCLIVLGVIGKLRSKL
jgi:hypothetical protein